MFGKVEAGLFEELDGAFCVHVMVEREAEVERPGAGTHDQVVRLLGKEGWVGLLRRKFAVCSPDGNAQLDWFEEIDVATERLVVIRGLVLEITDGSRDDARKLGVLRDVVLARHERRQRWEAGGNIPCSRRDTW